MMPVKKTSLRSYLELKQSGHLGQQQKAILKEYKKLGPCSRREIVEKSSYMYNAVSGRTKELLTKGLLEVKGKKKNSTGKRAEKVGLNN